MPKPHAYLGQHVLASLPGCAVGTRCGPVLSSVFSVTVTLFGKDSHGSMSELGVDRVVLASTITTRLQTVLSREVEVKETAVFTDGAIHAGTKPNINPDSAELLISTRAYDAAVGAHLQKSIERPIRMRLGRAPWEPEFAYYDTYPLTGNNIEATDTVCGFDIGHVKIAHIGNIFGIIGSLLIALAFAPGAGSMLLVGRAL
ncbi:peptidase dimerization domain-containing protein [Corynebacterium renale]|uniref:peptidase dimerization domain-containing protein n=1 Tax=Corynebacterium renale TaxID=1724 RepID=UPI000A07B571|nr:peptidase dimerization domain-containing protein [Corynebacterium renale]SQI19801.1 peptidase [Corynebacterium renale]